ncbi:hypothetical protein LSTR_LSTR016658 [Laodelphax striatellus]|uniref:Uncharacterized protein n=1 Tax=Laodelphax striatellus TaxID=195883 RepID=A0A482WNX9_LAOST|nr:hypothetical protein LSTR_LSTR016658 [Laodelphax striatellus]
MAIRRSRFVGRQRRKTRKARPWNGVVGLWRILGDLRLLPRVITYPTYTLYAQAAMITSKSVSPKPGTLQCRGTDSLPSHGSDPQLSKFKASESISKTSGSTADKPPTRFQGVLPAVAECLG